jgi:lipid-A-disaccharide synthase
VQRALPGKTATVFISTGELSGEMHAALLVGALQKLRQEQGFPEALIDGNGSLRMKSAGVNLVHDVALWSEMGLVANLLKAQHFHRVVTHTARYILGNQPDAVILVDSRVLNLNLARMLRQGGYRGRIIYYVSPVRWESLYDPAEHARSLRNPRFLDVKRYCDHALLIYPVSLSVYSELNIPHTFCGHPLCETAGPRLSDAEFEQLTGIQLQQDPAPLIVGAMVGSRRGEIGAIAPAVFGALSIIAEAFEGQRGLPPLHLVAPVAHPKLRDDLLRAARSVNLSSLVLIDGEHAADLMSRASLMIAKSGTGLHECVIMDVPAIMCYRVPPSLAWFLRYVLRFSMPYYAFPNLLAGRAVLPELVQDYCTPERIAEQASSLLFELGEREAMLASFAQLRELMCRPQPLRTAAGVVQKMLGR